jgi:hypothetical protein
MASFLKKPNGRWQARVSIKGKAQSVGTFDTKKEAEAAAAKFEAELKPHFSIANLSEELEKELAAWKKHLHDYESIHDKNPNSNYSLELELIHGRLDRIEKELKIYRNKKRLRERAVLERLPSFNIY